MKTLSLFFLFVIPCLALAGTKALGTSEQQSGTLVLTDSKHGSIIRFQKGMKIALKMEDGLRVYGEIENLEGDIIQINGTSYHLSDITSVSRRRVWTWLLGGIFLFSGIAITSLFIYLLPGLVGTPFFAAGLFVYLLPGLAFLGLGILPFTLGRYNLRKRYRARIVSHSGEKA